MNGRERLWAALQGQPVDELPVSLQGMDPASPARKHRDASWNPVFDLYAGTGDIFAWIRPQHASVERPAVRVKRRCLARTDAYEDWETLYQTPNGELRMVRRDQFLTGGTLVHPVQSVADFCAARWLLAERAPVDVAAMCARHEQALANPQALPLLMITEPIGHVLGLMGAERFALFLMDAPGELAELVEIAAGPVYRDLEETLATGIRPAIWTDGAEWVTPPYAGPETFRQLVTPYLQRMVEIAHGYGCPVLSHCHGRIAAVLDQLLETGIDGTHPLEAPSLGDITPREFRARVGRQMCCVGNLQLDDMLRAPVGEIARQVDDLLEVFSDWPDGGFILSVSGTPTCPVAPAQAVENYRYLLRRKGET